MPLEDAQAIDVVRKTGDGKIVLVITDAGSVSDPIERTACLVQKLKSYINSVVSGDLKRDFPEHTSKDYIIEVVCSRRPTPEMASISQVMPRKDPANKVPVRFVEFPEGAWGPAKPGAVGEQAGPRPGESGGSEELDTLSMAALEKGVALAENYLADGQKGFYFAVMGWDGSRTEPIFFRENTLTRAIVKEVEQYVRDLTPSFTVCVLVSVGNLRVYKRDKRDAIILVLHRRGRDKGSVYAKPIRRTGLSQNYKAVGRLELVGTKPGLFPG